MPIKALFPVPSYIEPFCRLPRRVLSRFSGRDAPLTAEASSGAGARVCSERSDSGSIRPSIPYEAVDAVVRTPNQRGNPRSGRAGLLENGLEGDELFAPNRNPAPFEFTSIPSQLPSESPWPRSRYGRGLPGRAMLRFASFPSTEFSASDFLLLCVSLSSPFGLPPARAETLRPAPGFVLLRANSARPAGFGSPANISKLSQNQLDEILPVPPKKHAFRLGSSSRSLSGCPSQTGRKGVTDACISIA